MRRAGGVFAALLVFASALVGVANARADGGDEPQYADFYTPPDPLPPGQPGDLIRTEPSRLVLEPSGQLGAIMATGTRIMYRSTDTRGNPIAVTGTFKQRKVDLVREGFDPSAIADPLYWLDPVTGGYEPLTAERYGAIAAGGVKL